MRNIIEIFYKNRPARNNKYGHSGKQSSRSLHMELLEERQLLAVSVIEPAMEIPIEEGISSENAVVIQAELVSNQNENVITSDGTVDHEVENITKIYPYFHSEYVGKEIAYLDWHIGDHIIFGTGGNFTVSKIFDYWKSDGLYAMAITNDASGDVILAFRGTDNYASIVTDIDPKGIGYEPYINHIDEVAKWAASLPKNTKIDITGHSLGSALSQWYTVGLTAKNIVINKLETYNSPGISKSFISNNYIAENCLSVSHYIQSGDIVSMAGEAFIPAKNGNNYIFYYTDYFPIAKHEVPMFVEKANGKIRPEKITYTTISSQALSDREFAFSIQAKDYYLDFIYHGEIAVTASIAWNIFGDSAYKLINSLHERGTTEDYRRDFGDLIHWLIKIFTPSRNDLKTNMTLVSKTENSINIKLDATNGNYTIYCYSEDPDNPNKVKEYGRKEILLSSGYEELLFDNLLPGKDYLFFVAHLNDDQTDVEECCMITQSTLTIPIIDELTPTSARISPDEMQNIETNPLVLAMFTLKKFTTIPNFSCYVNGSLAPSEYFAVKIDVETKTGIIQLVKPLDSGKYEISIVADNAEKTTSDIFALTVLDSRILLENYLYNQYTLDTDVDDFGNSIYLFTGDGNLIETGLITGGYLDIFGNQDVAEHFTITESAVKNFHEIYFIGNNDDSSVVRDIINIQENTDDSGLIYRFDNAEEDPENNEVGSAILWIKTREMIPTDLATIVFAGVKNIYIDANTNDTFKFRNLTANVNINGKEQENSSRLIDSIDFSEMNLKLSSGLVLNLDSTNHQGVALGQSGSIRINGVVKEAILSEGQDTITASKNGSIIIDETSSLNTVFLTGGSNVVKLEGSSIVTVKGKTDHNVISVGSNDNPADKSIINLSQSETDNEVILYGENIILTGGFGDDTVMLDGNYAILTMNQGGNDVVSVFGNNVSLQTGAGNDRITYIGSRSNISAGAGNDIIYVYDYQNGVQSTGSIINAGDGDDLVLGINSSGSNIYYAGAGNDFIFGGSGTDIIYGNSGNNLLAGFGGRDIITGGSGRDIILGNTSGNLNDIEKKSEQDIMAIFDDLKKVWTIDEYDLEKTVDLLGRNSIADGNADKLKRGEGELNIFFYNSLEQDLQNALDTDYIIDG